MDEKIKEALQLLVDHGYMEMVGQKYRLTTKLNGEQGIQTIDGLPILPKKKEDWERLYINFIMAADIPRYSESTDGTFYEINKYSEDGLKKFKELALSGIDLTVLMQSTKLYYKRGRNKLKLKIGNYIANGEWRNDYFQLVGAAKQGETELKNHVNQELNGPETFTRDQIG